MHEKLDRNHCTNILMIVDCGEDLIVISFISRILGKWVCVYMPQ